MPNFQNSNSLVTTIKWLAFLIMATPLIVSGSTLFPYVFGKAIAFQMLVEIMLAVYAWLVFLDYKKTGRFNYLPKLNSLTWALIAFFGVMTLSTIFSVDPSYSFWSKQERMDGLFNLLHFFILFFVLTGTFKDKKHIYQIFDVSLGIGFIICLHAVGQKLGWFFLPGGERVTATLGNSAFLATYLIFNIFFAFLLFAARKNFWLKVWYVFMAVLQIVILFLSYTRGAIFGFVAGLAAFAFFFIFFSKKNPYKKYAWSALLLIIILAVSLFAGRHANFVQKNHLLYRLTDFSLEQGTGITRIISWKIGLSAFLEKPLLGWGQENYYVAFNKHMDPVFFSYSGETFDRAHNKVVDLLVMGGILGLLAYLGIFISAFFVLWKERKKMFATSLILISLIAAYFTQNFFLFDMPVSYLMFFISLAAINIISSDQPEEELPNEKEKGHFCIPVWMPISAWAISALVIFFLWSGNLKPLIASQDSIKGQQYLSSGKQNDEVLRMAIESFRDSLKGNAFTNPETRKIFPKTILSAVNYPHYSPRAKFQALEFTARELEKGAEEMPYFFDAYLSLTDVYGALANNNRYFLADGEKAGRKLTEIYPDVPYLRYRLIINRILAEDYSQAIAEGQKAVALNENLGDSRWYLGLAHLYAGNLPEAKENMEKAVSTTYDYQNFGSLFQLAQLYERTEDYGKAVSFYQEALKMNPNEFQANFGLANSYKKAGQTEEAESLGQKLLASSTPQTASTVKEFLDSLK